MLTVFRAAAATVFLISPLVWAHESSGPEIDEDGNVIFHAELTHNISPIMPPTARESGYCCVMLDITKTGRVKNPEVLYCSHPVFWEVTKRTVPKITYKPRIVNDVAVVSENFLEHFSYRLTDETGELIKNSDGYPEFDAKGKHDAIHYCQQYVS